MKNLLMQLGMPARPLSGLANHLDLAPVHIARSLALRVDHLLAEAHQPRCLAAVR